MILNAILVFDISPDGAYTRTESSTLFVLTVLLSCQVKSPIRNPIIAGCIGFE